MLGYPGTRITRFQEKLNDFLQQNLKQDGITPKNKIWRDLHISKGEIRALARTIMPVILTGNVHF